MPPSKINSNILYERLLRFAQRCQELIKKLPKTIYNIEYCKQLIRSSASPGSNYIEAIEATGRKDFTYRLKICRKETKESLHWLRLIQSSNQDMIQVQKDARDLINEGQELIRIFTSSILTSEKNSGISK